MELDELAIEVTRRCNMQCTHCLRGDAQNVTIPTNILKSFLKQITSITCITISGGEPSLVPHKIIEISNLLKKYKIRVDSFYIATNAKKVTDEFVSALAVLFMQCESPEGCCVKLSGAYHEDGPFINENITKLKSCFTFAHDARNECSQYGYSPLSEGRGVGLGRYIAQEEEYDLDWDGRVGEGALYLNVKGQVIAGCNFSYRNQGKHIICKYNEDLRAALLKHNQMKNPNH